MQPPDRNREGFNGRELDRVAAACSLHVPNHLMGSRCEPEVHLLLNGEREYHANAGQGPDTLDRGRSTRGVDVDHSQVEHAPAQHRHPKVFGLRARDALRDFNPVRRTSPNITAPHATRLSDSRPFVQSRQSGGGTDNRGEIPMPLCLTKLVSLQVAADPSGGRRACDADSGVPFRTQITII